MILSTPEDVKLPRCLSNFLNVCLFLFESAYARAINDFISFDSILLSLTYLIVGSTITLSLFLETFVEIALRRLCRYLSVLSTLPSLSMSLSLRWLKDFVACDLSTGSSFFSVTCLTKSIRS